MLLNQLINQQQQRYNDIQAEIEALQQQQREIQAYLQSLGSLESKMESAASLLQEAIAEINQVCPDELPNYQTTIDGLFGSKPIAAIAPTSEPNPETEDDTPTTPLDPTPTLDIEVIPEDHSNGNGYHHDEGKDHAKAEILINRESLERQKVGDLRAMARSLSLNDKGTKAQLIERILEHYTAQPVGVN